MAECCIYVTRKHLQMLQYGSDKLIIYIILYIIRMGANFKQLLASWPF